MYASVIDDVIGGVREFFQDEGVDEQVLMELKNTWESKLQASKAIEPRPDDVMPPALKQTVAQRQIGSQVNHGKQLFKKQYNICILNCTILLVSRGYLIDNNTTYYTSTNILFRILVNTFESILILRFYFLVVNLYLLAYASQK